jgi:hypothetical protein
MSFDRLGAHGLCRSAEPLNVGIHHHLHKATELNRGLPAQYLRAFARVTYQVIHFGRSKETRILAHVLLPVEADVPERFLDEIAH